MRLMRRAMLLILLMVSGLAWGQKTRYGQAHYTSFTVGVQSSRLVNRCATEGKITTCGFAQQLTAVVGGKKLILEEDGFRKTLLTPGEYPGRSADSQSLKNYEFERTVELEFPDGKTRWYLVVGEDQ